MKPRTCGRARDFAFFLTAILLVAGPSTAQTPKPLRKGNGDDPKASGVETLHGVIVQVEDLAKTSKASKGAPPKGRRLTIDPASKWDEWVASQPATDTENAPQGGSSALLVDVPSGSKIENYHRNPEDDPSKNPPGSETKATKTSKAAKSPGGEGDFGPPIGRGGKFAGRGGTGPNGTTKAKAKPKPKVTHGDVGNLKVGQYVTIEYRSQAAGKRAVRTTIYKLDPDAPSTAAEPEPEDAAGFGGGGSLGGRRPGVAPGGSNAGELPQGRGGLRGGRGGTPSGDAGGLPPIGGGSLKSRGNPDAQNQPADDTPIGGRSARKPAPTEPASKDEKSVDPPATSPKGKTLRTRQGEK